MQKHQSCKPSKQLIRMGYQLMHKLICDSSFQISHCGGEPPAYLAGCGAKWLSQSLSAPTCSYLVCASTSGILGLYHQASQHILTYQLTAAARTAVRPMTASSRGQQTICKQVEYVNSSTSPSLTLMLWVQTKQTQTLLPELHTENKWQL